MFKPVRLKYLTAVAAAALVAAFGMLAASAVPEAKAGPELALSRPAAALIGPACSSRSWPNYDDHCLLRPDNDHRVIRVIAVK